MPPPSIEKTLQLVLKKNKKLTRQFVGQQVEKTQILVVFEDLENGIRVVVGEDLDLVHAQKSLGFKPLHQLSGVQHVTVGKLAADG